MDYLQVLLLALLPAAGNFAGGVIAELVPTTRRTLSRALHMAAGIVVAVVGVELLPEALNGAATWLVMLGFCLGGATFLGLDAALERFGTGNKTAGAWMVYAAVFIDLFSDGLMIGAGSAVSFSLALVLAIGQVTADVPEGFAGLGRGKRLLLAASFAIATVLGASISFWILRDQSESLQLTALAFTAGLLILAAVEEMLKQAHESAEDSRMTAGYFLAGFVLFTLVAGYFET